MLNPLLHQLGSLYPETVITSVNVNDFITLSAAVGIRNAPQYQLQDKH